MGDYTKSNRVRKVKLDMQGRFRSFSINKNEVQISNTCGPGMTNAAGRIIDDTKPPQQPKNLTAVAGIQTVRLTWTPNIEQDLAYYEIYRNTNNDKSSATKIAESLVSYFVDQAITAGTKYYYWVKAVDKARNTSRFSNGANATPRNTGTEDIQDAAITTAKIANLAVTNAKISDLSANKITTGYIVCNSQLSPGSNPWNGTILDANGLRGYKDGDLVFRCSESPYFQGEGHFGDNTQYIAMGTTNLFDRIRFIYNGTVNGSIRVSNSAIMELNANSVVYLEISEGARLGVFNDHTISWNDLWPGAYGDWDLGTSDYAWNNVYYCTLNDVCSLGMVEEIADPLEKIRFIKKSKDKFTPKQLPKADYSTLPQFIKTINYVDIKKRDDPKIGYEWRKHLQSVLAKNAEITYEDDEKISVKIESLDITATISLLLGAVRQLDNKMQQLEDKLNTK